MRALKILTIFTLAIASFYSTETCRTNPTVSCLTADGTSLYALEKAKVNFAASFKYPLGTKLKVCRGTKCVAVTVKDRGPARRLGRDIDLGKHAFETIADKKLGVVKVKIKRM